MDKYLQYTPAEFADDDSFIRWIKKNSREGDIQWENWLANNQDKAPDVELARKIVLGIQFKEEHISKMTEDKVWSKIKNDIQSNVEPIQSKSAKKTSIIKLISYGAVAAVALILLMVNLGSEYDTSVETQYAMIKTIDLPDGSKVQLNADSKLEFDAKTWDENRLVNLDGEAFFNVEKGSKFTVQTTHGNIEVLGTSFNVNTRNEILDVICKTGKVGVSNSVTETVLTPNQSVKIVNKKHQFTKDIIKNTVDRSNWLKGEYTYKNESLHNVIADLERQYDISISIDENLKSVKYTGGFVKGEIDNSLSEVMWPIGLQFDINGKNVSVTKE